MCIRDSPYGIPPYEGPIGAVRIGMIEGDFVVNPTFEQMAESVLDLRIAGTRDAILMVECGADQVPEETMVEALTFGHESLRPLIDMQDKMATEVGKPKRDDYESFSIDDNLQQEIVDKVQAKVVSAIRDNDEKSTRDQALDALKDDLLLDYDGNEEVELGDVKTSFSNVVKTEVRNRILDGVRPVSYTHLTLPTKA